jgi:tRNA nucleotidyltransferase (CCA-adding enzyme)
MLFLLVEMAGKVFIVGRSSSESLKIDSIVKKFGGGGHPSAGAAVIKGGKLEKIYRNLEKIINDQVKPSVTAEQIMSTPVKTVLPSTSIKMAAGILLRYGHTGVPVVEEGNLLGIISRRDIDKGIHHGLGHAPVNAFMSRNVKTIQAETSLSEIENLMIENNIGRLPVLKNGKLLGIVTRSDVLSTIHGENIDKSKYLIGSTLKKSDIKRIMHSYMSKEIYDVLITIGNIAEEMNVKAYLIGGVVRDLLLAKENEDLDIVVEGNGITFAEKIAKALGCKIRIHHEFGTAALKINDNLKIDIATSRSEYYPYPAALPQVEKAQLKQDLYRRDFTVNAMAICINKDKFGTLIDYFGGILDLKNCIIKVLHNLSFVEDPTRILRAIRFENRLNFLMEQETYYLALQGVEELKKVSKPRLGVELRLLLQENKVIENILRMKEINVLKYLLGQDFKNDMILYKVKQIIDRTVNKNIKITEYLLYLGVMAVDNETAYDSIAKMGLFKEEQDFIKQIHKTKELKSYFINLPESAGDIHRRLKNLYSETCILIPLIYELEQISEKVLVYLQKRQNLKINIGGKDLLSLGIMPGPIYSQIMDELCIALLNEEVVNNRENEKKWVLKYLES